MIIDYVLLRIKESLLCVCFMISLCCLVLMYVSFAFLQFNDLLFKDYEAACFSLTASAQYVHFVPFLVKEMEILYIILQFSITLYFLNYIIFPFLAMHRHSNSNMEVALEEILDSTKRKVCVPNEHHIVITDKRFF